MNIGNIKRNNEVFKVVGGFLERIKIHDIIALNLGGKYTRQKCSKIPGFFRMIIKVQIKTGFYNEGCML